MIKSIKDTIVVNMWAGPGAGKTTMMAGVFSELKWRGIDCEIAHEFAKELVWDQSLHILDNQFYVSAEQYQRIKRLHGLVDVIITDSPLLLGIVYDKDRSRHLRELLVNKYNEFENINYYIDRHKKYNHNGRVQSEEEALAVDIAILDMFDALDVPYNKVDGKRESIIRIADEICRVRQF